MRKTTKIASEHNESYFFSAAIADGSCSLSACVVPRYCHACNNMPPALTTTATITAGFQLFRLTRAPECGKISWHLTALFSTAGHIITSSFNKMT